MESDPSPPPEPLLLTQASVQEIQLELIRRQQFNAFDGRKIAGSLRRHRSLWEAVLMDRPGFMDHDGISVSGLIKLRDLSALDAAGIPYAIVGGMAVNAHRHARTTKDVDLLISQTGWRAFLKLVADGDFDIVAGRSRRFLDPKTGITDEAQINPESPACSQAGLFC